MNVAADFAHNDRAPFVSTRANTVLVYLDGTSSSTSAAETAFQLAECRYAHVEGVHLRRDAARLIGRIPLYGRIALPANLQQALERRAAQLEMRATGAFTLAWNRINSCMGQGATQGGPVSARWNVVAGRPVGVMTRYLDRADVCVLGSGCNGPRIALKSAADAILLNTGRPIVFAPPRPPRTVGRNIVIGWNHAAAASRTLQAALPWLEQADRIRLMAMQDGGSSWPSIELAADEIARRGFTVDAERIASHRGGFAPTLLWYAQNADLLVVAANMRSRLRNIWPGAFARHVLANAKIPVFMVPLDAASPPTSARMTSIANQSEHNLAGSEFRTKLDARAWPDVQRRSSRPGCRAGHRGSVAQ